MSSSSFRFRLFIILLATFFSAILADGIKIKSHNRTVSLSKKNLTKYQEKKYHAYKNFFFMAFDKKPSPTQKTKLLKNGIKLLKFEYREGDACVYRVKIKGDFDKAIKVLKESRILIPEFCTENGS